MDYSSSEDEDLGSDIHLSDDEEYPVSDENDEKSTEPEQGSNWANALKKVLKTKKPDDRGLSVLSKAKKIDEIERIKQERKGYGFEIDGEVKEETEESLNKASNKKIMLRKIQERRELRENLLNLRVKPTFNDREREKVLQKIGTKGIVQLFNAVSAQKRDVDDKLLEAGKPEYKREKVLKKISKKSFLDTLMNGPRAKSELVDNPVKNEHIKKKVKKEEPNSDSDDSDVHRNMWSALKEDFIKNNKNWDKSDEEMVGNESN